MIGTLAFSGLPVTEVSLPSSVTLIAQYAFAYCTQLQAITLPEGLQNIGSYSFVYTGFKQLQLPKSCTRIGTAAFFGSYRLEKVAGAPQIVEPYAFAYCQSLWDVAFSEGLTEIGDCAFYQTAVTSVSLPDSLYLLGAQAFASDTPGIRSKVMKEMTIGSKLSHIGENAFGGLSISQFVVASDNACFAVTDGFLTDKARRRLFACPVGMTGEVTIPDEIHEIAPYALYDCEYITMITIPETVDVIGQNAFCDHVPEGGAKGSRPILRCKEGSAAYVFAVTRNWPYLLDVIDDESKK